MHPLLFRSTLVSVVVMAAAMTNSASAQSASDLKTRCNQLVLFYDRYGVSRGENSDGARNHTRISAAIDCERGDYAKGIAAMEALLKQKAFDVPAAPTGLATKP